MKTKQHLLLVAAFFSLATGLPLLAGEAQDVIAKARARLAPESVLEGVRSIQYEGRILDPKGQAAGRISLLFAKPDRQRVEIVDNGPFDITAVNGHEGWNMNGSSDGGSQADGGVRLVILSPEQVDRLIVNTLENVYFYRGYLHRSGDVALLGSQRLHGREVHHLRFTYRDNLFYDRFVAVADGDLVETVGDNGMRHRKTGEMVVGGIRFPKTIEAYTKEGVLARTLVFDKIVVNAPLSETLFDYPTIQYGPP